MTLAQMVGVAGFLLARESATYKEHRHILSMASASCLLTTVQQGMMGAMTNDPGSYIPGGVMLGHAALTLAAFSVIPEAKESFRKAVAWVGGGLGAAAAGYASYKYENGSGFIPAVTTLGNALLFNIKDTNTPRARLGYIGMNLGHLFYWVTQPVTPAAVALTELMYLATHTTTRAEHDVPMTDHATGKKLSRGERLSAYFSKVIGQGKPATEIGETRANQGWERWDDRAYKALGKLIFGR